MINTNILEARRINGAGRFFFSSSACVCPQYKQRSPNLTPLKEEDAWPAEPEEGYGLEKLCQYYREDHGLETRVARFHNVYGPLGTYEGGKEKAPAALCRKIALAKDGDEIEIWGDGNQTRSFLHIDDCLEEIYKLVRSDYPHPLNIGFDRLLTINELVAIIAKIAGKKMRKRHDLTKPQGARPEQRQRQARGLEQSSQAFSCQPVLCSGCCFHRAAGCRDLR
ncbi:NAD-dependent epimerase/dehydratase family protein [Thermodesulforhabdus norvegica]|uniref:NAD-dependent epimerase/dehydratase family protein n=1 Tax=Thermodesulforhabdus norvegica TaxID=39841 RepID=UPI001C42E817